MCYNLVTKCIFCHYFIDSKLMKCLSKSTEIVIRNFKIRQCVDEGTVDGFPIASRKKLKSLFVPVPDDILRMHGVRVMTAICFSCLLDHPGCDDEKVKGNRVDDCNDVYSLVETGTGQTTMRDLGTFLQLSAKQVDPELCNGTYFVLFSPKELKAWRPPAGSNKRPGIDGRQEYIKDVDFPYARAKVNETVCSKDVTLKEHLAVENWSYPLSRLTYQLQQEYMASSQAPQMPLAPQPEIQMGLADNQPIGLTQVQYSPVLEARNHRRADDLEQPGPTLESSTRSLQPTAVFQGPYRPVRRTPPRVTQRQYPYPPVPRPRNQSRAASPEQNRPRLRTSPRSVLSQHQGGFIDLAPGEDLSLGSSQESSVGPSQPSSNGPSPLLFSQQESPTTPLSDFDYEEAIRVHAITQANANALGEGQGDFQPVIDELWNRARDQGIPIGDNGADDAVGNATPLIPQPLQADAVAAPFVAGGSQGSAMLMNQQPPAPLAAVDADMANNTQGHAMSLYPDLPGMPAPTFANANDIQEPAMLMNPAPNATFTPAVFAAAEPAVEQIDPALLQQTDVATGMDQTATDMDQQLPPPADDTDTGFDPMSFFDWDALRADGTTV